MSPLAVTFPFATIVIVLYLVWSEMVRRRKRTSPATLLLHASLCALAGGVLAWNMVRYPFHYEGKRWLSVVAIVVATAAVVFFVNRIRRPPAPKPKDEPLPSIFPGKKKDGE